MSAAAYSRGAGRVNVTRSAHAGVGPWVRRADGSEQVLSDGGNDGPRPRRIDLHIRRE